MNVTGEELIQGWPSVRPFLYVGSACIVAGGLVAAVTEPFSFEQGSWLAAYLVLVGGVAQIALGVGQAALLHGVLERNSIVRELLTWNLGSLGVMIGSLTGSALLTTLGGVILAVSLGSFLLGVRTPGRRSHRVLSVIYQGLATFVLLSIPVGLALSWIRHG
ncbi:MAG TPA: hypothetical protein VL068_05315 [Microthrixaceae bacterium]|nr:hypothetical protein [Microthrixaceae bacterium]